MSASLDDEHDLVAGTSFELSQAQEDCLLLAGRADRVNDHPILGRLNQGGQIRNQIVKEPMVQDHLEDTILYSAAVVIQAPGNSRPPRVSSPSAACVSCVMSYKAHNRADYEAGKNRPSS